MIMMTNHPRPLWRKSSYSNGQASCVEVGQHGTEIAVRDTKNRQGPALAFAPGSWRAFTRRVRNGAASR